MIRKNLLQCLNYLHIAKLHWNVIIDHIKVSPRMIDLVNQIEKIIYACILYMIYYLKYLWHCWKEMIYWTQFVFVFFVVNVSGSFSSFSYLNVGVYLKNSRYSQTGKLIWISSLIKFELIRNFISQHHQESKLKRVKKKKGIKKCLSAY